jgi:hypothetical protein
MGGGECRKLNQRCFIKSLATDQRECQSWFTCSQRYSLQPATTSLGAIVGCKEGHQEVEAAGCESETERKEKSSGGRNRIPTFEIFAPCCQSADIFSVAGVHPTATERSAGVTTGQRSLELLHCLPLPDSSHSRPSHRSAACSVSPTVDRHSLAFTCPYESQPGSRRRFLQHNSSPKGHLELSWTPTRSPLQLCAFSTSPQSRSRSTRCRSGRSGVRTAPTLPWWKLCFTRRVRWRSSDGAGRFPGLYPETGEMAVRL